MAFISVLTLSSEDIKNHLDCDEKRVHQIMGMAVRGKFTDSMMNSFWDVIDAFDGILETEDEPTVQAYEKMGRELEDEN